MRTSEDSLNKAQEKIDAKDYRGAILELEYGEIPIDKWHNEELQQVGWRTLGIAHALIDDFFQALHYLDLAIGLKDNDVYALTCRGNVYKETQEYLRAMEDYTNAIKLGERSELAASYLGLGEIYLELGKLDAAISHVATSLDIASENKDQRMFEVALGKMKQMKLV